MAFNATEQQDYIGHSRQKLWGVRKCGCCLKDLFVKENFEIIKLTCRCVERDRRCIMCGRCEGCSKCGGAFIVAGIY